MGKALYSCIPDAITIAKENQKCKVSNGCLLSADGKQLYYALNTRKTVKIPESVEEISVAAFTNKKFDTIEIGKNVKKIGAFAFEGARVKKLNVLGKIGRIGIKAFSCTRIKNVEFANKVKLGVDAFDNSVQIKFNKFKSAQTTIENATLGTKYNIKFAKIIGADGYQIKVKKGKKAYQYTTSSNSYKKSAPKYLTSEYRKAKEYNLQDNAYLKKVSGAAYVTVRPYKRVKKKIVYGRWSERIVLSYNK